MAYRFRRSESVAEGVRRIAREQVTAALESIGDTSRDPGLSVHKARKCCKRIRALLRLVREPLGEPFAVENRHFRDAARLLSDARDRQVMLAALDDLAEANPERLPQPLHERVRSRLVECSGLFSAAEELNAEERAAHVREFESAMRAALERIDAWSFDDGGFSAIRDGARRSYRAARRGMERLNEDEAQREDDAALHEWRKDLKDHWYHTRLLENIDRRRLRARGKALESLSERLGLDHDGAVLAFALREAIGEAGSSVGSTPLPLLESLLAERRAALLTDAFDAAGDLLDDGSKRVMKRWGRRWKAWRRDN